MIGCASMLCLNMVGIVGDDTGLEVLFVDFNDDLSLLVWG